MDTNLIVFCKEYEFHLQSGQKDLRPYLKEYNRIMGTTDKDGVYFKRLYNSFIKDVNEFLDRNVKICQSRLKHVKKVVKEF